ncbi:MAG: alpha-N-arabinofuranosidase [Oscillospiraceae bacterium]|nr:alpha-N-arabinofuranosidase [Oscillospiraceae bacterium]
MKAKLIADKHFTIGEIDKRIYGSFIEHLGRAVYGGIYEPGHPLADEHGFRKDVLNLVKELDVPIVRYPGGNFVSGYHWEDGTGDKSRRPRKMELAWQVVETNQVGIDEFHQWAKKANSQVMMAVNLGTRGPEEARNCLEYCNGKLDTYYANLRRENGFEEPFGIPVWCLGNEMDGPWQICSKTAEEYGRIAAETAKMMKWTDPDIQLVACGSSNYDMPTFGDWELTVLDHTYEYVDYLSLHQYYGNPQADTAQFLCCAEDMDAFIKTAAAICDVVKAKKHSSKQLNLSFDEWNVWFHSNDADAKLEKWQVAPPQLEDVYTFEDALVVGSMLMTLQNNCDRVKMACLAQLVNVIAPIMTENGGKAWAQSIYYPFLYASRFGRGITLRSAVESDTFHAGKHRDVPYLLTSVVYQKETNQVIVYAMNRSLDADMELDVQLNGFQGISLQEHVELYCEDMQAVNTKDVQNVAPRAVPVQEKILLKKHSWNMLRFG